MKFKLRPISKNIFITFITATIISLASLIIYRLIAGNFGPEGIGKYSLIKRVIGFLHPLILLGLGIGLPRYIAISRNKEQRSSYLKVGSLLIVGFTFVSLIFINLFKNYFAKTFFGTAEYTNLILPFSFFLIGLILHSLIFSYFRGRLLIKTFNFLQMMNLALVPLTILIFFENITIEKLIILIGITTFIIAFIFSLYFIKEFFLRIEKWQLKKSFKELLQYSIPRVPSIFMWQGLLSIGPIFAAHFTSIQEVGYLSISLSILAITGIVIAPLGLIILPKVSNLLANGRQEVIKENINFLIGAILQLPIFICFQLIIFIDDIVKYWLGSEFSSAIPIMRIVFISILFYAFHEGLRNILDAVKVQPLNTINLLLSFAVFLSVGGILLFLIKLFSTIISLSITLTSAMACLGILTYISIRKIYPEKLKKDLNYLCIAILVNILLGSIAVFAKEVVTSTFYYIILFEILMSVIYLSILCLLKMEWIREIPKRLFL